jgi:uncharacterized protein (TIGR02001 family)
LGGLKRFAFGLATPSLCLTLAPATFGLATFGLATLGLATPARAQLSASVGVQSDYLYRGISLSSGLPAATVDLAYDHPSGVYAGASAIGAVVGGSARSLGFIEYLGYATPRRGGVSWDLGVSNQDLAYYYGERRIPLRYAEAYVGAVGDRLSAHLHYAPNYLRPGYGALYVEVDGSLKPAENWRLFAHLGNTIPVGDTAGRHPRYDARAGVARQFGPLQVQASVVATTPDPPGLAPHHRTALIVGANWFF